MRPLTVFVGLLLLAAPGSSPASPLAFEFEGQLVDNLVDGNTVGTFTGFVQWDSETPDLFTERDDVGVFAFDFYEVSIFSDSLGDWTFTTDNAVALMIPRTDKTPPATRWQWESNTSGGNTGGPEPLPIFDGAPHFDISWEYLGSNPNVAPVASDFGDLTVGLYGFDADAGTARVS
jgi:hypothetical protein